MITHIILQTVNDTGIINRSQLISIKDPVPLSKRSKTILSDFYLKIDGISGQVTPVVEEQLCKLCQGTGGIRYWYAQDHSDFVACPICNHGDQEKWDNAKIEWKTFNRQ